MVSTRGVRRLTAPQTSPSAALTCLEPGERDTVQGPSLEAYSDIGRLLERYFLGEKVDFQYALDLEGTPFQLEVWGAVRTIPYGETRSYTWVARQIGRPGAARAVGQVMRANPVCIIVPCHRVIGARGDLCGYGGPQGIHLKQRLLDMEYRNSDK
jgi:methylated-DNA-[protein]-cysteine S-methyltransferase